MRAPKLKLLLVCALVLLLGAAPLALGDWNEGDGHKMHYPQLPKEGGWNVAFTTWLADDWQCSETGPVTDIHFWISWEMDMVEPIDGFSVTIHSDVPAGADPCVPWSHPGDGLWSHEIYPADFTVRDMPDDLQGWLEPWEGWYILNDHVRWQQINIEDIDDPFIQQKGEIYWLEIDWWGAPDTGWKESGSPHFNDDGVYWDPFFPPFGNWVPLTDPFTGESMDLAFVITGEEEEVVKWEQPPCLDDPCMCMDVDATDDNWMWWAPQALADDFLCNATGLITDIHIWGSWLHDYLPYDDPNHVWFTLCIYSNDPCGPMGWSEPSELLWTKEFHEGEFDVEIFAEVPEAYYIPCEELYMPDSDWTCWLYSFYIDPCEAFVQEEGRIYWLALQAHIYNPDPTWKSRFGWKNSSEQWNDDAVWSVGELPDKLGPWQELRHPMTEDSVDLAFKITTVEEEVPIVKWAQMPDESTAGMDIRIDSNDFVDRTLADDFECNQPSLITDVHFWGSWKDDIKGNISKIHLSIHEDIPEDDPCNPTNWSIPGELLWEKDFFAGDFDESLYYTLPDGDYEWFWDVFYDRRQPLGDQNIWQYDIYIDPCEAFLQLGTAEEPVIYWLDIYVETVDDYGQFGWKTSRWEDRWNDSMVRILLDHPWWEDITYPPEHPYQGQRIGMAFMITGKKALLPKPLMPHLKWSQPPIEIDPTVQMTPPSATYIGPISPSMDGMDFDASDVLYGLKQWDGVNNELYTINQATGATTLVGTLGEPNWSSVAGLTFASDGTLYAVIRGSLYTLNPATGAETLVGPTGFAGISGLTTLAAPPGPDLLYGVTFHGKQFFSINRTTGAGTLIGMTDPNVVPFGLSDRGTAIYTYDWSTNSIVRLDPATGQTLQTINIGATGVTGEGALAFRSDGIGFLSSCKDVAGKLWSFDTKYQGPTYCGWDEPSLTVDPCTLWKVVADDFHCLGTMPVTSIHWWGSYVGWDGTEPFWPPDAWRIGFWSNVPDPDPCDPRTYSCPEKLLWQIEVDASRVQEQWVGQDYFPDKPPDTCFQYNLDLEPNEYFWQEDFEPNTIDNIYWLSIAAIYPTDAWVLHPWGWKTRPWSWMDDAVTFELEDDPEPGIVLNPDEVTPIEDPLYGESFDMAFELDTDPNWIKWEQLYTGIRDWPHYEDMRSMLDLQYPGDEALVADDWRCLRRTPVTAIVWWGSYIGYGYEACSEEPFMALPVPPDSFVLTIFTDSPAGSDPCYPFSHPNEPILDYYAFEYDEVLVGYDKHPYGAPNEPVFRYSVRLPEDGWFRQPDFNEVFWLSVQAVYDSNTPNYDWGWTNHEHVFNDNAVARYYDDVNEVWVWEELYDQTGASEDMSFMLFTDPDECVNCADYNIDYIINFKDYADFADDWLWTGMPGGYNNSDLDCDGDVDWYDVKIFTDQWLDSCP